MQYNKSYSIYINHNLLKTTINFLPVKHNFIENNDELHGVFL